MISCRRGSARIDRSPSARGPNSIRPWNQPTTSPASIRSATSAQSSSSSRRSRLDSGRRERCRALLVRVLRSPVGVLHREPARRRPRTWSAAPTAVPESPAAGWTKTCSERRLAQDPPVRDRVQRDTACEAQPRQPRPLPERLREPEVVLLQHGLERRGDVLVVRGELGLRARAPARVAPRASARRAGRPRACPRPTSAPSGARGA